MNMVKTQQKQHQQKSEQNIHQGARNHNQNPLPDLFVAECHRRVGLLVLPYHTYISADRKGADRIVRVVFLALAREDFRPHPDRKFVDSDPARAGAEIMPQLVNHHQQAEHQKCQQDIEKSHSFSFQIREIAHSRASRSTSKSSFTVLADPAKLHRSQTLPTSSAAASFAPPTRSP